jgi:hypothetical protein
MNDSECETNFMDLVKSQQEKKDKIDLLSTKVRTDSSMSSSG